MSDESEAGTAHPGPDGREVQRMFGAIAHRYDLLNHLLSLSIDRYWRRRAVDTMASAGFEPGDTCLDLCSGTGDLALNVVRRLGIDVLASDFCHPMLTRSVEKVRQQGRERVIRHIEADALQLPFEDATFRFVSVAFGVRNLEHLEHGLNEILRVLRPDGRLIVLEFSKPELPVFRELFAFYFAHVLPRIGACVSGTEGPYKYLPSSVGRFWSQAEFVRIIESVGFTDVGYRNLTGGIAALHWGSKPSSPWQKSDGPRYGDIAPSPPTAMRVHQ